MLYRFFIDEQLFAKWPALKRRYGEDALKSAERWFAKHCEKLPTDPAHRDDPYADAMAVWEEAGSPRI